jgi:MFS superfamily sulfate permease-like transporter
MVYSGAAMVTGLTQIKPAFGFGKEVPNIGSSSGVAYNYELFDWYVYNWSKNYNPYAAYIFMGIYIPLFAIYMAKTNFPMKQSTKRKNWNVIQLVFSSITRIATPILVILSAIITRYIKRNIKTDYSKRLKIVGLVPSGLNIFQIPMFNTSWSSIIYNATIIAMLCFMESYSVACNTASVTELKNMHASQELFAIGSGNVLNCFFSGYPVTGSFSRSALSKNSGSSSQLSQLITLIIVLLALLTLTNAFYWIPSAALGAIVMIAIISLIDISKFWYAWKTSKKDFFEMIGVCVVTIVFRIDIGFFFGLGFSLFLNIVEDTYSPHTQPRMTYLAQDSAIIARLNCDLIYFSSKRAMETLTYGVRAYQDVEILKLLIVDLDDVKLIDITGALALKALAVEIRQCHKINFVIINGSDHVNDFLKSIGLESDYLSYFHPGLTNLARELNKNTGSKQMFNTGVNNVFPSHISSYSQLIEKNEYQTSQVGLDMDNV